jgi:hypothetical protein
VGSASGEKPPGPPSPDATLPPDQRAAKYAAQRADFDKKYQAWLQSDFVKSQDLRSLPQYPLNASYESGYGSLEEAADHAGMAVLGQVVSVDTGMGTHATFRVERTAKGTPSSTISFMQSGGIRPVPDFDHPSMAVSEAAPMLFPGDRAVLLLEPVGDTGQWRIQNFSGEYHSDSARKVHAVKDNHFHDVDGMSESEIMDRIDKHVHNK